MTGPAPYMGAVVQLVPALLVLVVVVAAGTGLAVAGWLLAAELRIRGRARRLIIQAECFTRQAARL